MLLAVDTSTQMMGLALYDGEKVIGEQIWESHNHHTITLAPAITDLMSRCGANSDQLTSLAIAKGPGSFTSLRIGLSMVKALSLSIKVPLIGVPTLDIVAASQPISDIPLAAVLQVGRGRLALGRYEVQDGAWVLEGDLLLTTAEEFINSQQEKILLCGELNSSERQMFKKKKRIFNLASPVQSVRRPSYLAEIAWTRYLNESFDDTTSLAPIYLRVAGNIPE